jgi:hypothetical protein
MQTVTGTFFGSVKIFPENLIGIKVGEGFNRQGQGVTAVMVKQQQTKVQGFEIRLVSYHV